MFGLMGVARAAGQPGVAAPAFDPASLFGAGDAGAVIDLKTASRLATDTAGTTLITDTGQSIAYAADIGPLAKHAIQSTAGSRPAWAGVPRTLAADIAPALNTWTLPTGWSESGGVLTKTAGTANAASVAITLTAGKHYVVSVSMTRSAGTLLARFTGGTTVSGVSRAFSGGYTDVILCATGNTTVELSADASFAGTVKRITVREVSTWVMNGAGFDGNDLLRTATIDCTATDKLTFVVSGRCGQAAATRCIGEFGNYLLPLTGSAGIILGNSAQGRLRGATGFSQRNTPNAFAVASGNNRDFSVCVEFDLAGATQADEIAIEACGVAANGTLAGTAAGGGNMANGTLALGGTFGGVSDWMDLIHRCIVINRILTTEEKTAAVDWARDGMVYAAVLGDSTSSILNSTIPIAAAMPTSALVGGFLVGDADVSKAGDRIASQKTAWQAISDVSKLEAVFVQIGINDVKGRVGEGSATTATVISDLQDLIDTVQADVSASCKVYVSCLTPCKTFLDAATDGAAAYAAWLAVNESISGAGSTPITNVDGRITSHVAALNDGSGNLLAIYDYNADGVHPSNEARFIIAQAWRAQLEEDGLL